VGGSLGQAMLVMLVDTPDPRYQGGPDPDDERERRWEPIGWRLLAPAAGSVSCFVLSPFAGGPLAGWVLTAGGVALGAQFVRLSLRDDGPERRNRTFPAGDRE
jgi:hypothetical protein